ncbi:helix-turn-helix domain-containing protein [Nocardioides sp. NPDC057772]|uniref:helix-turn-helix domain-containing protein n=1 Tax=Nocardioides sp. NPDC057772 TaxID=3346245 RepID=UPI00366DB8E9
MTAVFARGPQHPAQRLMMLALADSANDQGVTWPSVATLAEKCSVVPRTAQRTLANLEADGWIETRSGGTNRTNVYQLRLDRLDPELSGQPAMPSAGAPVRPTPDAHVTPDKSATLTPTSPPPLTPTSPQGDAHVAEGRRPRHPNRNEPSGTIRDEPSSGRGSATPTATTPVDVELDQQSASSPPPVKPKAKRATARPADFRPSDSHVALAAEQGIDLRDEWPKFCDFHDAKGSTFKDWDAALRTWIRNARTFSRPGPARHTGNPSGVDWDAAASRARARDADNANPPRGELS